MLQDLVLFLYLSVWYSTKHGIVVPHHGLSVHFSNEQVCCSLSVEGIVLCSVLFLVLFWASLALLWSNRIRRDVCFFPVSLEEYEENTVNLFTLNVWYNLLEMTYNPGFLIIEYFYYWFKLFLSLYVYNISIHISYLLLGIFTEIISIFNIHLMCDSILRSPVVHSSLPEPSIFIVLTSLISL